MGERFRLVRFVDVIAHTLFGCSGFVAHYDDGKGQDWIGLRCEHCGKLRYLTRSALHSKQGGADG